MLTCPHPNPLPRLGEGARNYSFFRFPFSEFWEKGLGDEGEMLEYQQLDFEFGIADRSTDSERPAIG